MRAFEIVDLFEGRTYDGDQVATIQILVHIFCFFFFFSLTIERDVIKSSASTLFLPDVVTSSG